MAKPKQDTLVKVSPSGAVTVWTNDPKSATFEIADIEGVSFVVGGRKNPPDRWTRGITRNSLITRRR